MKDHHPADTRVYRTEIVLPSHTNALGTIFGGTIVAWADITAAIAAQKHARGAVVTVSFDQIHFIAPIQLGQIVNVKATVNRAWSTSMEVGVRVEAEDPATGEVVHAASAYATFVALDSKRRPRKIGAIVPQTEEEKLRFAEAGRRREVRIQLANELKKKRENC